MGEGWVKLHRQIAENKLWLAEPFTKAQAWIDLILLANHKDGQILSRGIWVEVKRGQVGWSEVKLAERWKWSRGKLRRFLGELKTVQQIEQQNGNVTSLITITNYEQYQSTEQQNGHQTVQQTDSKRYTNKNGKKEENEKKKSFVDKSTEILILEIYEAYPKKVGKPDALRKIKAALKTTPPEELLKLTQQYGQAVKGIVEKQFIPNPSTWFNQQRYSDDPETWVNGQNQPKDRISIKPANVVKFFG